MTVSEPQPTRYLIQEKHLSLCNKFTITDDSGVVHYKVNSTFFTMGDKLFISDANGNALIKIRQENLHFRLTYKIFAIRSGGTEREIASIRRTGSLWQHKLEISSDDDGNIVAMTTKDSSPTKNLYWVDIIDNKRRKSCFCIGYGGRSFVCSTLIW